MPQFEVSTYFSQAFWLIVCFGLTYLGIAKLVLPRYKKILEKRIDDVEQKIKTAVYLQKEILKLKMSRMQKIEDAQKINHENFKEVQEKILEEQTKFVQKLQAAHDAKLRKLNESIKNQRIFLLENLDSFMEDCCTDLIEKYMREYAHDHDRPSSN